MVGRKQLNLIDLLNQFIKKIVLIELRLEGEKNILNQELEKNFLKVF